MKTTEENTIKEIDRENLSVDENNGKNNIKESDRENLSVDENNGA